MDRRQEDVVMVIEDREREHWARVADGFTTMWAACADQFDRCMARALTAERIAIASRSGSSSTPPQEARPSVMSIPGPEEPEHHEHDTMSASIQKGTRPDYRVSALRKNTNFKATVGAAWKRDDGTISIALNSFVTIEGGPDIVLTMFPNDTSQAVRPDVPERNDEVPF